MADSTALRSIKNIVKRTLLQSGKSKAEYKKFYQYCIDGYRDLRIHHVKRGRVVTKETVDQDLFTVDYPEALITLIDVGIPDNGQIWWLSKKDRIVTTTTTSGGSETYDSSIGEGKDLKSVYWDGFGSKGNVNIEGYYVEDRENRRLMLRDFIGTKVWLYYTTSGTISEVPASTHPWLTEPVRI